MRAIEKIDDLIQKIEAPARLSGHVGKRDAAKLRFYRDCRLYLEMIQDVDSLIRQKQILMDKKVLIMDRYMDWCYSGGYTVHVKNKKQYYRLLMGVPEINRYLRNIDFLLKLFKEGNN